MIRYVMLAAALLALGCKEKPPALTPDAKPPVVNPTATTTPVPDARPSMAQPPARDARPPDAKLSPSEIPDATTALPLPKPTGKKVGVEACDEYLEKMAKCVARLSPESAEPMAAAMEDTRKAWQETASTTEGRAALVDACKAALDAAKSAAKAMGCSW